MNHEFRDSNDLQQGELIELDCGSKIYRFLDVRFSSVKLSEYRTLFHFFFNGLVLTCRGFAV